MIVALPGLFSYLFLPFLKVYQGLSSPFPLIRYSRHQKYHLKLYTRNGTFEYIYYTNSIIQYKGFCVSQLSPPDMSDKGKLLLPCRYIFLSVQKSVLFVYIDTLNVNKILLEGGVRSVE